jgi:hypothetical protein
VTSHDSAQTSTGAEGEPARTRLNKAAPGDGGGGSDLIVHDNELGALGNMAREVRQRLSTDGDHARPATFDAAISLTNDGMTMGTALTELHDAWNTKLNTLLTACAHISNHLDFSRSAHKQDEHKIATNMRTAQGNLMTVSRINDYIR